MIVLCILTISPAALGVTLSVRPDGTGFFPTIQSAITSAATGDTILLEAGTYSGPGNRDIIPGGKNLWFISPDVGLYETTIDCLDTTGATHRAFIFNSGESDSTGLRGLTIVNGSADYGGAILFTSYSSSRTGPIIILCHFLHNSATISGSAIFADRSSCSYSLIDSCSFRFNLGDAVGQDWQAFNASTISNSTFSNNSGNGLSIYPNGSDSIPTRVVNCNISNNAGDGIHISDNTTWSLTDIVDCQINNNSGWGIHTGGDIDCPAVTINRCTISGNGSGGVFNWCANQSYIYYSTVSDNGGDGIYLSDMFSRYPQSPIVSHTKISNNSGIGLVSYINGAVYSDNVISNNTGHAMMLFPNGNPLYPSSHRIISSTMTNNGDSGIHSSHIDTIQIYQSIIHNNDGPSISSVDIMSASVACSDVHNNQGGNWPPEIAAYEFGYGNISADPLFCDPNALDYHLQDTSFCLPNNNDACDQMGALGEGCSTPPQPIATIKSYDPITGAPDSPFINTTITIDGTVFVDAGTYSDGGYYVADESGGINVYHDASPLSISEGDSIRVTGPLWYDGNGELYVGWPGMTVLASGISIEAEQYSIARITETFDRTGDFVSVFGEISAFSYDGFYLGQGSCTVEIRIDPDTGVTIDGLQIGMVYRVDGPCFKTDDWIWLSPRRQSDLIQVTEATDVTGAIPACSLLHSSYPNPFNPKTTISYSLSKDSDATVSVHDLRGRLIKVLTHGYLHAGEHIVSWDGSQLGGTMAAAGTYIITLDTGHSVMSHKVVLAK